MDSLIAVYDFKGRGEFEFPQKEDLLEGKVCPHGYQVLHKDGYQCWGWHAQTGEQKSVSVPLRASITGKVLYIAQLLT